MSKAFNLVQAINLASQLRGAAEVQSAKGEESNARQMLETAIKVLNADDMFFGDEKNSALFDVTMDLLKLADTGKAALYSSNVERDCVESAQNGVLADKQLAPLMARLYRAAKSPGNVDAIDACNDAWKILKYQVWRRRRGSWHNASAPTVAVPRAFRSWRRKFEAIEKQRGFAL